MTTRPITFCDHVIGHTSEPEPATPDPVHVTPSYDLGVAAATELVYLDRRPSGGYPYRMAVGTDLINAAYGFVMTLSLRCPPSDFLPIITGSQSDQTDQNRFLRNIGLHLIALSEAFGGDLEPGNREPRTHQADLLIIAQVSAEAEASETTPSTPTIRGNHG